MKTKILFATISIVALAIIFNGNQDAMGMSAGAPPGVSGAPSDMVTCKGGGCHSGNPLTIISGWITSNIPAGGYTPGQTYTITATATYNGLSKFGFEISPQDAQGNLLGTLVNTSTETHILVGNKYITQTISGNSNPNFKTWTFNWIAPPSGSGSMKFYGTFACCDGDGTNLGDFIYYSTLATAEAPTPGTDAGILPIVYPTVFVCDSNFIPIATLRNFGTNVINSVSINYFVDANSPSTYTWNGILPAGNSVNVSLPALIISTQGSHTFTAATSNPNSGADAFTVNDSKSVTFQSVYSSRLMPFAEGFENSTFPPAGWVLKNPDNGVSWARYTSVHYTGVASLLMNNYGYPSKGQHDELITPEINLTTSPSPSLSFQHAYQMYADSGSPNHSTDTLSIFISTDCGTTWNLLYKKYDTLLTTVIPNSSNNMFFPTTNSAWRMENISLASYSFCDNAILKFQSITDYGNQLYIDDINIDGPLGIRNQVSAISRLDVFPVPVNDYLNVNFDLAENNLVTMRIFDVEGKLVRTISEGYRPEGKFSATIDLDDLPSGIYLLNIATGENSVTRKFIVE